MKSMALIFILFSLLSCSKPQDESLKGSIDRSGKIISTTVYFYDSVEEVRTKFREVHNLSKDHPIQIEGFAQWVELRDAQGNTLPDRNNASTCQIYIVRPKSVDDEYTLTLGHEMLHCVLGEYHSSTLRH